MLKRIFKVIAIILALAVAVVGGYAAYVFIAYYRLPDNLILEVQGRASEESLRIDQPYSIVTWNVGFGAYSADYGFFMDGGTESRAYSKEAVLRNIGHAVEVLQAEDADILFIQELDIDATRSYHVDEAAEVASRFGNMSRAFAQNYDSPYLFYPLLKPHGASKAGIMTLSKAPIQAALRRSLPVESGFMKLLDLDRCYSVCRVPVDGERELCLFNLHLSAYTSDGLIATEQLHMLTADMAAEYAKGNYVIAGGDFNKDVLGNSEAVFGVSMAGLNWAQPIGEGDIPIEFRLVSSLDPDHPVPSCRNADGPYVPSESQVLTVDGFIVSENVSVVECRVIDEGFAVSDHNPVKMTFTLES